MATTLQEKPGIEIAEFDKDTIHLLPHAPEYIKALVQQGPAKFIDNAHVEMKAISIDDLVLPLIVANPKRNNSNVCSPYTHYVKYHFEELIRRNRNVPKLFYKIVLGFMGVILKICQIDSVIYLNNWLFATNPYQELSRTQIARLTSYLQQKYPKHTIVHRSVNTYLHKEFYDILKQNGYLMVTSRTVNLLDTSTDTFFRHKNIKKDLKLLKKTSYNIINNEYINESDMPRLTKLYRSLYMDKYTYLNPQLNSNFFSLTVNKNILTYRALKKNNSIDAFASYKIHNGILTSIYIGYDPNLPKKIGLYRMGIGLLISEAKNQGLLLHLSAGVDYFKGLRGTFTVVEYDAIYYRHLSARRKIAWNLIKKFPSLDHEFYKTAVHNWLKNLRILLRWGWKRGGP